MKITYNCMGDRRKSLAGALSHELNSPTKYLGMPSASYVIGDYLIEKDGTVTGPDNKELVEKLAGHGFMCDVKYDDAEERAEREMRRLKLEDENVPDYSNKGQYGGDENLNEHRLTVEMPLIGFTPEKLDNLTKMVTAKEALLKIALDAEELPIQVEESTIKFPWFKLDNLSDATCYTLFIDALCNTAKTKKRIIAKDRGLPVNPKYTMRTWLLSLGMNGEEYKQTRKLLLSRLNGNSSRKEVTDDEASE